MSIVTPPPPPKMRGATAPARLLRPAPAAGQLVPVGTLPASPARLKEFVQDRRNTADRARLQIRPVQRRGGSQIGVTQEEVALHMGLGPTWYGHLERGDAAWTETQVKQFADILCLVDLDRLALYHLALGWVPPMNAPGSVAVSEADISFLNQMPFASFLIDETLRVRYCNPALIEWNIFRPGENIVEWVTTHPDARRDLVSWATDWVTPMLQRLRTNITFSSGQTLAELEAVRDTLIKDRDIKQMWDADHTLYDRVAGDVRRGLVNGELREFVLWTAIPAEHPGWRVVSFGEVRQPPARLTVGL
jgi:hypothetical protein